MANSTCELCRAFGVTCENNYSQDYPPYGTFKFVNRTVFVATGSISNTIGTSQPISECPAVVGTLSIESVAKEYISRVEEFSQRSYGE